MSPELIAVLTIGVTLAGGRLGTVLWLTARLDRNVQQLRAETHADLQQIRGEIRALETRVSSIEQGHFESNRCVESRIDFRCGEVN